MRTLSLSPIALLLVACSGDKDAVDPGDPCVESGNICTWLGIPGEALFGPEGLDRLDSSTYMPQDIDFAPDGTAYFPDFNNHRIRRVDLDGVVETVSGTGMLGDGPIGVSSCWEDAPCDATAAAWNHPTQLAVNPSNPDELYVAAWHNSRISIIDVGAATLTWYAGTGGRFFGEGDRKTAVLDLPSAAAFSDDGSLYFSDQANHLIRRVGVDGVVETVAGQARMPGMGGDGGPASAASLHGHTDQKADPGSKMTIDGNLLYVADTVNGVIRVIDLDTGTIDTFAGKYTSAGTTTYMDAITKVEYQADAGSVPGYGGDGGDALEAVFNTPRDVAVGLDGELYIADTKNSCVRVVRDGIVETFAGTCGESGFDGDGGAAADAKLDEPFGVAVDPEGNVYIADTLNHVIRKVTR